MDSVIQQQPLQQTVPSIMSEGNNKGVTKSFPWVKILLFMLGVVILIGVAGGSYYLGTKKNVTVISNKKTAMSLPTKPVTVVPTNIPTQTLIISPTPDITANWQTYSPPENAYSIKYPNDPNWKLMEVKGNNYVSFDVQCPQISCPQPYNIYDFGGGISNVTSVDAYIQSLNTTDPAVSTHATPYVQDYRKLKIDGLDAVETLTQTSKLTGPSGPEITIFLVSKGQGYSFGYTFTNAKLNTATKLNQLPDPNPNILSTLQFAN